MHIQSDSVDRYFDISAEGDAALDRLLASGETVDVTFPDGASWTVIPNGDTGRWIKTNGM